MREEIEIIEPCVCVSAFLFHFHLESMMYRESHRRNGKLTFSHLNNNSAQEESWRESGFRRPFHSWIDDAASCALCTDEVHTSTINTRYKKKYNKKVSNNERKKILVRAMPGVCFMKIHRPVGLHTNYVAKLYDSLARAWLFVFLRVRSLLF